MCSIYGSLGKNYKNIETIFSKELHHRGPDGSGIYYDDTESLVLGHTRLSIIDLSNHAHQPMSDESNSCVLVFNGEIYNYKEIKQELILLGYSFSTSSDTEVVLKGYMQWGEECVKHFRGMFAFCIYDKHKNELFLARDRFGIKPLIYSFLDGQFIFSSELKPFLTSNIISKKLSLEAIGEYFQYGSVNQPSTILDGVHQLMPGHSMKVKLDKTHEIKRYYDYVIESAKLPKIESYEEAVVKVREELEIATKYHMVADVDVGAFLSGGVDSTAVVAMMNHYSSKQINTFSVGFKSKINIEDETDIASRSAKKLGCKHHNIKIDDAYIKNIFDDFVTSIDQPSVDGINTYIVSLETAKDIKVALSGLGGDEIFAGYPHFKAVSEYAQQKRGFVSFLGKKLNHLRPNRFTNKYDFVGEDEAVALYKQRTIHKDLSKVLQKKLPINDFQLSTHLSSLQKISKAEIDKYMLNTLLRDNDVLSMAHSLEVRPILLDHKLVELAFSLDDSFKVRNGMLKSVFVDSVKDIIPAEVWQREKTGFEMPFSNWMNGVLNDHFKAVVHNKLASDIFLLDYLTDLRKRVISKKLKRSDWLVFVFLCWLEKFPLELQL
ncbi:asparagine synthase (glutamine-hydrolyzing) [Celerinatantimonas yamalensis]|uniref:asparagine synthase (glutamine-hydrolyzing) n=1 Tax=Celerinatantimonas yamalensis TaxID=559956 RepID=A0ABW9G4L3_9GAMM